MKQKLIFVYNADSSLLSQAGDLIHKIISPKTYQCRLCGLTYSGVSMKNDWKDFINSLSVHVEFLHKDEFLEEFPNEKNLSFPIAFMEKDNDLIELISTEEINKTRSLEELENLVQKKSLIVQSRP